MRRELCIDNLLLFLVVVLMLVLLLGCRDFFLFKVKVVFDVMFLLLILGGFVFSLDLEFVFVELFELLLCWLMLFFGVDGEVFLFMIRFGVVVFRLRCVKDFDILFIFEGVVVVFLVCCDVLYCDDGFLVLVLFVMMGLMIVVVGCVIDGDVGC